MGNAIENARLRELMTRKGMKDECGEFVAAHQQRVAEAGRPEIRVPYELMDGCGGERSVNVTPWLRGASLQDACRFARLALDEHDGYDPLDPDVMFLAGMVETCMDEDVLRERRRADTVRVMLYDIHDLHACIRGLLPDIRPLDHEIVVGHLVPTKGPMGPGDAHGATVAGTLI